MDRRSWLRRRKSSEKSPGEVESSGSISSYSERLSDEQASLNQNIQSPEVTSKAAANDEEVNDDMKVLNEKLFAALSNICAKEELVKQHAKVAEEAVTGWEKAEKEVSILKQQLEAAAKNNSALEDRVSHLDGALKECVRQLRQSREQLDSKVEEAVDRVSQEWESEKAELESQLAEVQAQLETASIEAAAAAHLVSDLPTKLDAAEKENASMRLKLALLTEQLELRTLERDLSTQRAEAASKQHLESTKKSVKLEAELRRLKNAARKSYHPMNDCVSFTASSAYADSLTDSHSDSGPSPLHKARSPWQNESEDSQSDSRSSALITELGQFKSKKAPGKNAIVSSSEISLMDDFLEMERLAALKETEHRRCSSESGTAYDGADKSLNVLNAELGAMIDRTVVLEEKLERTEAEKTELELALTLCKGQLDASKGQLKDTEVKLGNLQNKLSESQNQLKTSQGQLKEAEAKVVELQCQLTLINDLKQTVERELEVMNEKRHEAESQLKAMEEEMSSISAEVHSLEDECEKQRALSKEAIAKCHKLEGELLRMKHEADLRFKADVKHVLNSNTEMKVQQEKELAVAADKLAECQQTIASLGRQLKSLATLDELLVDL
ncbi:hypothetical protein Dimus_011980 [Dionaea muscipula]